MTDNLRHQVKQYANLGIFQLGFFMALTGILVVRFAEELNLSPYQVSLYLTLNYFGYMLGGFGGSGLAKWLGQKRLMDGVLILVSVIAMEYCLTTEFSLLCILSLLLGICGGVMEGRSSAAVAAVEPERVDHNMNVCLGMMTLGYFLSCACVALILILRLPWKSIYGVIVIMSLSIFFRYHLLDSGLLEMPSEKNRKTEGKKQEQKSLLKNTYFVLGCVAMCLYTGMEVMFFSWLTTFFENRGNISFLFSVLIMCAFYLFLLLGKLINNILMRYSIPVVNASCATILAFVLMNVMVNVNQFFINCICAGALGFTISCLPPFIIAFTGRQTEDDAAYSYTIGCGGIGTILIPGIVGVLSARMEMRLVLMLMSPAFLVNAILFVFVFYPKIKEEFK